MRAAIQSIARRKTGQGGRTRKVAWDKPLRQAVKNKRSPWLNLIQKITTSKEFYGGPAWQTPESLQDKPLAKLTYQVTKEIYDSFAPLFVEGTIEAGRTDGWLVAMSVMVNEFFSGQTLSYEPTTYAKMQIRQDTTSMMTYGRVWDNLAPSQQDRLRRLDSQIGKLEQAAADEREQWGPPEEISLIEQNEAAENVRRSLSKKAKTVLKRSGARVSGLSRRIGGIWLNNTRYEAYQIYAADEIEQEIEKVSTRASWRRKDVETKKQELREIVNFGKSAARDKVLIEIERGKL